MHAFFSKYYAQYLHRDQLARHVKNVNANVQFQYVTKISMSFYSKERKRTRDWAILVGLTAIKPKEVVNLRWGRSWKTKKGLLLYTKLNWNIWGHFKRNRKVKTVLLATHWPLSSAFGLVILGKNTIWGDLLRLEH